MDLLSSIRKSGSRGGVNFSWDEVQTSQHRENYLGHSLMAPVGRWQKNKDLSWYAKGDDKAGENGETAEERKARERKEEIRKIKEAEEDALARALGLPVADRNVSGANAITVGEVNRMVQEVGVGEDVDGEGGEGRSKGFGDFVGTVEGREALDRAMEEEERGGLVKKGKERPKDRGRDRDERRKDDHRERRSSRERRHRHRSRSGERRRHRSRSGERHRRHDREDKEVRLSRRSHSPERRERKYRSRSPVGRTKERDDRGRDRPRRSRSRSREHRRRRYS